MEMQRVQRCGYLPRSSNNCGSYFNKDNSLLLKRLHVRMCYFYILDQSNESFYSGVETVKQKGSKAMQFCSLVF